MEQEKLEQKVEEIWERQGFEVSREGDHLIARKDDTRKKLQVFSSEEYSPGELEKEADPESLVFVDEDLSKAQENLENDVSIIREEEEKDYDLPSYELIGEIAVINELTTEREETVEGILDHHPHVKTILLKEEPLSGEFRVGGYEKLYGEETETVHTEFGCRYRVDPTVAYFSERYATERKRVIDQIQKGENVLVMFAGVGPFAILAAREADPSKVVTVEKNPAAFDYLEKNVELNSVEDTVEPLEGDVSDIVPDLGKFDRIIMPLPESADQFFDLAFEHLEEDGVIHYYRFMEGEDWKPLLEEVRKAAEQLDIEYEIIGRTICGDRGPNVKRVCVEIKKKR